MPFDYSARSALILVSGFRAPDAVREAGQAGLTGFLAGPGARSVTAMAGKALAAAAQTARLPGEAAGAALIAGMARQLPDLDGQIKDTTRLITERFRTHPRAAIIESMPGTGTGTGPRPRRRIRRRHPR